MFVVGSANTPRSEIISLGIYFYIRDYAGAFGSPLFVEPLDEFAVSAEFSEKFSSHD